MATYEGMAEITGGDWEGEMAHSVTIQFEEEEGSYEEEENDTDGL